MGYTLFRLAEFGGAPSTPAIGDGYPDFAAAMSARDDDVLAQLSVRSAPPREINHVIVGPGVDGPRTAHPIVSFVGADIADNCPELELAETAEWLRAVHHG
jgi:hypothetical protein